MANGGAPYGGAALLADTSAWTHVRHLQGADRDAWDDALRLRQIATCDAVVYELGRGARNVAELQHLEELLSSLRRLQITDGEWHSARVALGELAAVSDGYHRPVSPIDALVAVTAERYGYGVLHYDHHFDRLAEVVGFTGQPISAGRLT